jgi:hypothetical protein
MSTLLAVPVVVVALASAGWAGEVRFPVTVDHEVLQAALRQHLHEQPGGGLEVWRTPDGCGSFRFQQVAIEATADARLKISGPATATAAVPFLGWCWANLTWTGHADIVARPDIGADWQLRLHDLEANLHDGSPGRRSITGRLWTVARGWVEAELARFTFDLGPPVTELAALLGAFGGPGGSTLVEALKTMRPAGVAVRPDAVEVTMAIDVPTAPPVVRAPEPALSPAEIQRWEAALDGWDGFVAFVVKDLAGHNAEPGVREGLLAVLLDARRQIVETLARGPVPGTDPVRKAFVGTWNSLRGFIRRTAVQQQDVPRAFRYVVFLAAGDALAAIEATAPAAGIDFSADGLRRLARSLDPTFADDPLQQSDLPDARLQHLFRLRDPDAPPRPPRRKPAGSSWWWLQPRAAHAAEADEWRALGDRLHRWVPAEHELDAYRATVDRLLSLAAERSLDPDALDERFDALYHHLVKATAWQESCWRQFVRRAGAVTYLESFTGDVGLMQINVRIWRGFFNADKLRWNAAYNAGAGAEILQHLLIRYGTREAGERLDNAARATYSAYNGGPTRYRRYRMATPASQHAAVDRAFWTKYRAVAAGTAEDAVLCRARAVVDRAG